MRSVKKRQLVFFDHFNSIFNLIYLSAIILIKGHKVDFLCLMKRVWFYYECLLISCVF